MNRLDIFTMVYGRLHNYGLPFWMMTPLRRVVRGLANVMLPRYLAKPQKFSNKQNEKLIVSLTSFPARIDIVWIVIECLKRQTILPKKIILWLSEEQFPNGGGIPTKLKDMEDDIFEIRLVPGDIRSHKKYLYAITEFPEDTIITVDDDVYYNSLMIEVLVNTSIKHPNCIIANKVSNISYASDGCILPYLQWGNKKKHSEKTNLLQIGIGGVLYPPHCMHPLVTNEEVFSKVAPLADDIWLNSMARLMRTDVVKAPGNLLLLPIKSNSPSLSSVNNGNENMNDQQISQIRDYLRNNGYDDVYDINFR